MMESYIVQLDFSAAFDRVSHSGLFKLKSIGVGGSVLSICRKSSPTTGYYCSNNIILDYYYITIIILLLLLINIIMHGVEHAVQIIGVDLCLLVLRPRGSTVLQANHIMNAPGIL